MARRRRLRIDRVLIALAVFIGLIGCMVFAVTSVISLFSDNDKDRNFTVMSNVSNHEDRVTVIIDPGHGGYDGGTVNGDLYEKDIVLKIAKRVKEKLLDESYINVVMTRETDIALGNNKDADLINRAYFSSQYGAEYFVSIHVNSFEDSKVNGIEIYKKDDESEAIAQKVMDELMALELAENRGIFDVSGLMVLKKNIAKSILVETGYISDSDYEYLSDDQELMRIADAIAKGIIKQLESDKKE